MSYNHDLRKLAAPQWRTLRAAVMEHERQKAAREVAPADDDLDLAAEWLACEAAA